jgi:hypothetical protein
MNNGDTPSHVAPVLIVVNSGFGVVVYAPVAGSLMTLKVPPAPDAGADSVMSMFRSGLPTLSNAKTVNAGKYVLTGTASGGVPKRTPRVAGVPVVQFASGGGGAGLSEEYRRLNVPQAMASPAILYTRRVYRGDCNLTNAVRRIASPPQV